MTFDFDLDLENTLQAYLGTIVFKFGRSTVICLREEAMYIYTRMVQLPATAAIEYVAACWVPGVGGIFVGETRTRTRTKTRMKTNTRTKTKTVRGAYARSPQVQCVYAVTHRLGFLCLAS